MHTKGTQSLPVEPTRAEDVSAAGNHTQHSHTTPARPFHAIGSETLVERTVTAYLASIIDDPSIEPARSAIRSFNA
jgi:hypothetical protein